jgi:YVTN family beta-propeller protein
MRQLLVLLAAPLMAGTVQVYVANSAGDNVTVIDTASDRVSGNIKVSNNPHGIVPSPDKNFFYVSSETENVLDIVERKTSKVIRRVPIGKRPNNVAITPDGRHVYVCIREESWVDIVDTVSMEKVKSVPVGKNPHNVYMSPEGKWMIATSMGEDKLTVIDIKTQEPVFSIPMGGVPRPVAIDAEPHSAPKRLFVQLSDLHGFAVVDFAKRKVVDKITLPDGPPGAVPLIPRTFSHGMAITPDRKELWVTSLLDNSVSAFTLPDLKRITTIHVGKGPDWMTFTPDGKRCYLSNAGSDSVSVLDVASKTELTKIAVGKVPKRIIAVELP